MPNCILLLMLMFTAIESTTTSDSSPMIVFTGNLTYFNACNASPKIQNFQNCVVSCGKNSSCAICPFINNTCWSCANKVVSAEYIVVRTPHGYPIGVKVFGVTPTNFAAICKRFQFEQESTSALTTIQTNTLPTTPSTCPPGWKYTFRDPYSWCLALIINATLPNTYANGKKMCTNLGAQISGLWSIQENDWLRTFDGTQAVYIDGTRRAACSGENWISLAECQLTSFTDPTLTRRNGYAFADGEPNGDYQNGVIQSCFQMVMTKNKLNPYFGKLDDMSCDAGYGIAAVLCGQYAKL